MTIATWITALGALITFYGIATHDVSCIVVGSFCDIADGWIARSLNCVTTIGADLDWQVDVAVSHALVWTTAPSHVAAPVSLVLIGVQVWGRRRAQAVSGRALVSVVAIASWLALERAQ